MKNLLPAITILAILLAMSNCNIEGMNNDNETRLIEESLFAENRFFNIEYQSFMAYN